MELEPRTGAKIRSSTIRICRRGGALSKLEQTDSGNALLYSETVRTRDNIYEPTGLLPFCKNAAERRGYAEWYFEGFKDRLLKLYKGLAPYLVRQDLPLVIVDEAHHWRHSHRQDCQDFRAHIAPAFSTPSFVNRYSVQLHRDELLEVLSVGDATLPAFGEDRVAHLQNLRERIRHAMEGPKRLARAFLGNGEHLLNSSRDSMLDLTRTRLVAPAKATLGRRRLLVVGTPSQMTCERSRSRSSLRFPGEIRPSLRTLSI